MGTSLSCQTYSHYISLHNLTTSSVFFSSSSKILPFPSQTPGCSIDFHIFHIFFPCFFAVLATSSWLDPSVAAASWVPPQPTMDPFRQSRSGGARLHEPAGGVLERKKRRFRMDSLWMTDDYPWGNGGLVIFILIWGRKQIKGNETPYSRIATNLLFQTTTKETNTRPFEIGWCIWILIERQPKAVNVHMYIICILESTSINQS